MKKRKNEFEDEFYIYDTDVHVHGFTAKKKMEWKEDEVVILIIKGKNPLWGDEEEIWLKKGDKIKIIIKKIGGEK